MPLRRHASHRAAGGCSTGGAEPPERLPTYPWVDDATALRTLAERGRAVKTLSAQASITLERPDGQTVRLDGAIVMEIPGSLRLRAWKFGQAVFDLTYTPDGLWIEVGGDSSRRRDVMPASLSAARMAKTWALLDGEFFNGPFDSAGAVVDRGGPTFTARRAMSDDSPPVSCDIERATLTPRRYHLDDPGRDSAGKSAFTLSLGRYADFGGVVWPTRIVATSAGGTVTIVLRDVEINGELAPNAFVPPRRAEKQP